MGKNRPSKPVGKILSEMHAELNEMVYHRKHGRSVLSGIPTGFSDVDFTTSGLHPGVTMLASASDELFVGDFALNILLNNFENQSVAYFLVNSPVIDSDYIFKRLAMTYARLSSRHIAEGFVRESDLPNFAKAIDVLMKREDNLHFYDVDSDPRSIHDICRNLKDGKGLDFIVIDKLQGFYSTGEVIQGESFYWKAQEVRTALYDITTEFGLPALVLSELKKKRLREKSISVQDVKAFGSLESDALTIILEKREESNDDDDGSSRDAYSVDAHIRNNYWGPWSSKVSLTYMPPYCKYVDASRLSPDDV